MNHLEQPRKCTNMNRSYSLISNGTNFEYKFHSIAFKNWNLSLLEEKILKGRKSYDIKNIKRIVFDVEGTTYPRNPYGPTICISTIYLEIKDKKYPKILLSIVIQEDYILSNESESFRQALLLSKTISEKYNIPYKYLLSVETKESNYAAIAVIFLFPVIYLVIHILEKYF